MSNPEDDGMMTAIERDEPLPVLTNFEKFHQTIQIVMQVLFSQQALLLYLIAHWIVACGANLMVNDSEGPAFLNLLYFMVNIIAFLGTMSYLSFLLVPLFIFCGVNCLVVFYLVNVALLNLSSDPGSFTRACSNDFAAVVCRLMRENVFTTLIKSALVILLNAATCTAIFYQFERNAVFEQNAERRLPPPPPHPYFYYHPHTVERERTVGATNLDEPPRYSTLEPVDPLKPPTTASVTSPVTSPPRYSYWERTFGRAHTSPTQVQQSPASNRSRKDSIAKNV